MPIFIRGKLVFRTIIAILMLLVPLVPGLTTIPTTVKAAGVCGESTIVSAISVSSPRNFQIMNPPGDNDFNAMIGATITFSMRFPSPRTGYKYYLQLLTNNKERIGYSNTVIGSTIAESGIANFSIVVQDDSAPETPGIVKYAENMWIELVRENSGGGGHEYCQVTMLKLTPLSRCENFKAWQNRTVDGTAKQCYYNADGSGCLASGTPTHFSYDLIRTADNSKNTVTPNKIGIDNGLGGEEASVPLSFPTSETVHSYGLTALVQSGPGIVDESSCSFTVDINPGCDPIPAQCGGDEVLPPDGDGEPTVFELCSQVAGGDTDEGSPKKRCEDCLRLKQGVWTAIGCIPAEPSSMIKSVITIGVGIGGGVALLMTLIGGFLLTTSQGNPKQQETAKEMITSAVIGLLFVMFSVIILQFVGVTILQIPGFGTPTEASP